nr:hypothetical protein TetV2_00275 [Oceanusvirus sp.]
MSIINLVGRIPNVSALVAAIVDDMGLTPTRVSMNANILTLSFVETLTQQQIDDIRNFGEEAEEIAEEAVVAEESGMAVDDERIGQLTVLGNSTLSNALDVRGVASFSNNVSIDGNLLVRGSLTAALGIDLISSGLTTASNLTVEGVLTAKAPPVFPEERLLGGRIKHVSSSANEFSKIVDFDRDNGTALSELAVRSCSSGAYTIRVYDATNNLVLGQATYGNSEPASNALALSGDAGGNATIEVHCSAAGAGQATVFDRIAARFSL